MDKIDFSEVGAVKCTVYDKDGKRLDSVTIKPRNTPAPYPLPQKVLRSVYSLVNMKREYLSRQEEIPE